MTLKQLRDDPDLTPEQFMNYFRDFHFKLGRDLQPPKVFLATKSGDCDDFACLADEILREKHYTTKLIAIFMNGQTHVVCYVKEIHGYLDYNRRKDAPAVQVSNGTLEDVANKVAAYFRTTWNYASEFTYHGDSPKFGRIVFHQAGKAVRIDEDGSRKLASNR